MFLGFLAAACGTVAGSGPVQDNHAGSDERPPAAPLWAIPFGQEFWRLPRTGGAFNQSPSHLVRRPGLAQPDVGDALDRIEHAFIQPPEAPAPSVRNDHYRATLAADGFNFAPTESNPGAEANRSAANADQRACEAELRTLSITRGGREFVTGSQSPAFTLGNTRQRLLGGDSVIVEHLEARVDGVEVTWVVPQQLSGEGPLAIDVELAGLNFSCQTASGPHFADEAGTPRLRISPVTAVDSTGRSWRVPLVVSGQQLHMEVPAEVLAEAQFPLAIDPIVSAEFGLDQPVTGPTPCTRAAPAIASNDSGYLVVWTHGAGEVSVPGVYAARVDPVGQLLDPFGILISASAAEQTTCKVAALPDSFLVAWAAPHGTSVTDWDILAARVRQDGTVLDTTPLPVCTLAGAIQNSPAVAANGDNYLVVWTDSRGTGIYGSVVSPDGRSFPTNGFAISTAAYEQCSPAVASLGTNYLVVWQDYRNSTSKLYAADIYGARVAGSGTLLDTNAIVLCRRPESQYQPAVAANGTNYLVVWEDYAAGGNDILGARVGANGGVLDTNALVVAHAGNAALNPAVTSDAGDFVVVWQDYRESPATNFSAMTFATRVHGDGSVAYLEGVALSSGGAEQWWPAVAGSGKNFLAAWQDARNNPNTTFADVYGAVMDGERDLLAYPDAEVSRAANAQMAPKIAACGTNFFAVWADNRNATTKGWDIFGARLNRDGAVLDAAPIAICTVTNQQSEPAIAAQGTNYLVVWTDQRNTTANAPAGDIYGALVDLTGKVSPAGGFPICLATNDQSRPAVSAFGDGYLVAWQDGRNSQTNLPRSDIYGARLSERGEVLDPGGLPICTNIVTRYTPAIAGNTAQALVAWSEARSMLTADIYGARVALDGSVLDTNALRICTATAAQSAPAAATDGAGYFVVWTDSRPSGGPADIYGALISASGAVVSPTNGFPLRVAPGQQSAPKWLSMAWTTLSPGRKPAAACPIPLTSWPWA